MAELNNQQLTERILLIENKLNDIQTALNNVPTKAQMKSILALKKVESDTDALETRITNIESTLNDMQTALNNVPTKGQLKSLTQIRQTEIDDLKEAVTDLNARVTTLENI